MTFETGTTGARQTADRTESLDEGVAWAIDLGATAILPQLRFPWHADPDTSSADLARIQAHR